MKRARYLLFIFAGAITVSLTHAADEAAMSAIQVRFDTNAGLWRVVGSKHRITLNPTNLECPVETPGTARQITESREGDLLVRSGRKVTSLRLAFADGTRVTIDLGTDKWEITPSM
jgi:hypothetical protein